jgi:hypothetical protein
MVLLLGCGTPVNSGLGGAPLPVGDAGNSSGANTCETICASQARAGCANFSMTTCVSDCARELASGAGLRGRPRARPWRASGVRPSRATRGGDPTLTSCVAESVQASSRALRAQSDAGAERPDGG